MLKKAGGGIGVGASVKGFGDSCILEASVGMGMYGMVSVFKLSNLFRKSFILCVFAPRTLVSFGRVDVDSPFNSSPKDTVLPEESLKPAEELGTEKKSNIPIEMKTETILAVFVIYFMQGDALRTQGVTLLVYSS